MSDYLGNLLARSFTPAAGVRPQVSSLFDPRPASAQMATPLDADLEACTPAFGVVPPNPDQMSPHVGPRHAEPTLPIEPTKIGPEAKPANEDQTPPSEKYHAPQHPVRATNAPPHLVVEVSPDQQCHSPLAPTRPQLPVTPTNVIHTLPVGKSIAVETVQPIIPEEGASAPIPLPFVAPRFERDSEQQPRHQVKEAAPAPLEVEPAGIQLPARFIRPQVTGVQPVLPAVHDLPAKLTAPSELVSPTINVTIGRIEVRATPAPVPARSKGRTAPILSLDDYLHSRAQEGRR